MSPDKMRIEFGEPMPEGANVIYTFPGQIGMGFKEDPYVVVELPDQQPEIENTSAPAEGEVQ